MLGRLPLVPEIVFCLVGAYLVYLPAVGKVASTRSDNRGRGARAATVSGTPAAVGLSDEILPVQLPGPRVSGVEGATVLLKIERFAAGVGYMLGQGPESDLRALSGRLRVLTDMRPRPRIRLRVGADVPWGEVAPAVGLCKRLGLVVEYAGKRQPFRR